jgi:hypothetical protein
MIVEKLLTNNYLLLLTPKLRTPTTANPTEKIRKLAYSEYSVKFNMKALTNLIIEKEECLEDEGIWLINQKYHGMTINEKRDFETFASVENLLDPNCLFLRVKNYYIWEPNQTLIPRQAINYRWKYTLLVLQRLCKQLQTLEDHGFALPHLRWKYLDSQKGISQVLFPTRADGEGRLESISHSHLFTPEDPYCAP